MIKHAEIVISVILLFATNSINFYFLILISFIIIYYVFDIHINMNLFAHML